MKKIITTIILFALFIQCKSLDNNLIDPEYKTSGSTILNYEDASKKYTIDSIDAHFRIYIDIEKPYIIKSVKYGLDEIYYTSGIEGSAIFRVKINRSGKIVDYRIIKTAGLGLDKAAVEIIKGIQLSPVSKEGYNYKASANLRIVITSKETI